MATSLEIRPVDRDALLDAIYSAFDDLYHAGIREDMIGIVAGGLGFLITGEDGERLTDAELLQMTSNEDALAAMLFCDLRDGWQGFPNERDRTSAWTTCNTIAAAFCKVMEAV